MAENFREEDMKDMKCDTCRYFLMCRLRNQYLEMLSTVAQITDIQEPEYSQKCKIASGLFDGCVNYEEAPK